MLMCYGVFFLLGTTGDPKGAMLTHRNLISNISGIVTILEASNHPKVSVSASLHPAVRVSGSVVSFLSLSFSLSLTLCLSLSLSLARSRSRFLSSRSPPLILHPLSSIQPVFSTTDVYLSYLPLAHMLERLCVLWMTMNGARIGFFRGDVKLLMSDVSMLRPTLFVSVPRLLNRVYDKVMSNVEKASPLRKKLFFWALASKEAELKRGIIRNNSIWDKLVFSKVQSTLGGRVKMVVTGAAPISKQCLTFLRCAFGCPVIEGYGQTENSAGATLTLLNDTQAGTVGAPIPCG